MSQERTEREDCYFCHGSGKKIVIGEPDIVNAVDCPVCKGSEIDRLNAVITDLKAENEIFRGDIADQDELIQQQAAEMYRRNGVIIDLKKEVTDLTAKVQERDERLEKAAEWMRKEGHQYISESEQLKRRVEERDKEIERLSWSNTEQVKEIERLRAALEEAESDIYELLINSESPTFIEQYAPQAKAEIRAALKGAE